MVVSENFKIPDDSELTVDEIKVTYPVLQAASFYIGKKCEYQNNEFLLCRQELNDPRSCINEGKAVTACALDFFKKLKKHCREDFEKYVRCLDRSTTLYNFRDCRKAQATVDKCVLENLNIERPPFGYFCEVKVHDSPRPPPPPKEPLKFPDAVPELPTDKPEHPAKFTNRRYSIL